MILSSLFGFYAFILLVIPGYVHTSVRSLYMPVRKESVLTESSRILTSSLVTNIIIVCPTYHCWYKQMESFVNETYDDKFRAYLEVSIHFLILAVLSSLILGVSSWCYYKKKFKKRSQKFEPVLDSSLRLPKQASSISYIILNDGTQVYGQIAEFDNAPDAQHRFMRVKSPYWIETKGKKPDRIMEGADLLISLSSVQTLENQTGQNFKLTLEDLKGLFGTDDEDTASEISDKAESA